MAAKNWTDPGSGFGVATAIFALTALPAGILFGTIEGDLGQGMIFGFLFGLLFAVCMTPFMRSRRSTVRFADRARFERTLMLEMSELRYTPTVVNEDLIHFDAPQAGVFEVGPIKNMNAAHLNRIQVHLGPDSATVIGPRWMVGRVLSRLGGAATAAPEPMPRPTASAAPGPRPAAPAMPPPATPPGWYPDPERRFDTRYWNGDRWTEHVMARDGRPAIDR